MPSETARFDESGAYKPEHNKDSVEIPQVHPHPARSPIRAGPRLLQPAARLERAPAPPLFRTQARLPGPAALMLHAMCPNIGRPEEVPDGWRGNEAYRACTGENL